jgi:hypothetical protein
MGSVSYLNWNSIGVTGYGAQADYRHHFSNNRVSPAGLYLSPNIGAGKIKTENVLGLGTAETSTSYYSTGVNFGHQWIYNSGFSLDLFFGYGLLSVANEDVRDSGGYPSLGLAMGYAF